MFTLRLRAATWAAAMVPALGVAAPLTLEQSLDLAVQLAPATRAARAGVTSASEAAHAAGQLPDPQLTVGIENLPVTGSDRFSTTADSQTMKRVGISQEWLSSDKRAARQSAAQALVDRETLGERAAEGDTRLQTALAYLDAWFASETLKLSTLTEHHLHEQLEAARARLASSGSGSQEVLATTSALGIAEDEAAEVGQAQADARVALQRWIGRQPDELEAPRVPAPLAEEDFVAQHPMVLAARREVALARQEAHVAATNRESNWTWQVSYGQRTGYSDMVTVGVSIPLQVAPEQRQDRETASKLALVEKAEAGLAEATRSAEAEYRTLASDLQRLTGRIERYRTAVIAPASQRTRVALAGYGSNQVGLEALFEARHMEVEVQRKLLALQRDLARVQAQLAYRPLVGVAR
jgi:outer membrane protein TolC